MTDNKFSDLTHWEPLQKVGFGMGWSPGWRPEGQSWNIGTHDTYWDTVLGRAREAYGDPNIRFDNTDDTSSERHLVFGDGTRLPADGTLAYRDSASNQN